MEPEAYSLTLLEFTTLPEINNANCYYHLLIVIKE